MEKKVIQHYNSCLNCKNRNENSDRIVKCVYGEIEISKMPVACLFHRKEDDNESI